jgi:hypothetical protein
MFKASHRSALACFQEVEKTKPINVLRGIAVLKFENFPFVILTNSICFAISGKR